MTAQADMGMPFIATIGHPIRQYMRQAFGAALQQYDRLVMPLAGRLQMAECAVDAGWRTGEIQCADGNIFSALLGYMAAGKDLDELAITFPGDTGEAQWARAKWESCNHAAALCFILKYYSLNVQIPLDRMVRQELWRDRDRYGNQFQATIMRLAEKLSGLDYSIADVFPIVSEAANDERTVIYIGPPRYVSTFACVGRTGDEQCKITWNAPVIAPFQDKDGCDKLHHDVLSANALAFLHWRTVRIKPEHRDRIVFAVERGGNLSESVLCNRPDEANTLVKMRQETDVAAGPYPVCTLAFEITPDSTVSIVPTGKAVALYYADLWGHPNDGRLGTPYLIMLDGAVLGVAGMSFAEIRKSIAPHVLLNYLSTVPGLAWADVLAMLVLTCEDARLLFQASADAPLLDVTEFKRMLWHQTESGDRPCEAAGLQLKHRLRQDNGEFQLGYLGGFRSAGFAEVVAEFHALPQDSWNSPTSVAESVN